MKDAGHSLHSNVFFDTIKVTCKTPSAAKILQAADAKQINLRQFDENTVRRTLHNYLLVCLARMAVLWTCGSVWVF